ncbi:MAG: 2-succinyl-5-enolpyruvyl-6-hydroxy-3-cyclohexene-1-carboxylic-acid synthase [Salibacteraceae bacterium]
MMPQTDKPIAAYIAERLSERGIVDVVVSPGSRNAPILMSLLHSGRFNVLSVLDERTAAFIALGISQAKTRPVAVCCTSGSAVLNYAPAFAEAFYQRVPLIAITADRPRHLINQGEGQSIRQPGALGNVVCHEAILTGHPDEPNLWLDQRLVCEAVEAALHRQLPVHINLPLDEPLYNTCRAEHRFKYGFTRIETATTLTENAASQLLRTWSSSKRALFLVGQANVSEAEALKLAQLAEIHNLAVVTETTSNITNPFFVSSIDRTIEQFLDTKEETEFVPDLLITYGSNLISKKIKAFLRKHRADIKNHWHIGESPMDTFACLSAHIPIELNDLLARLIKNAAPLPRNFCDRWRKAFFESELRHTAFIGECPYSDLLVFHHIIDSIPEGWSFQMGNSSVVRYVQLFSHIKGVRYFGNRGVSGIEGCVSTALGYATSSGKPTLCVVGDHTFRYDSNALVSVPVPPNLKIVVINNGGGNIFRIIDGPSSHNDLLPYIEKPEKGSIEKLVGQSSVAYRGVRDEGQLIDSLEWLFTLEEPAVLEIFTDASANPHVLKDYFISLKSG